MDTDTTSLSIYCAPDAETFAATFRDLSEHSTILMEASTCLQRKRFLCDFGSLNEPTVLFGAAIDQEYGEDDLQNLAQSVIDFYLQESEKNNAAEKPQDDGCTGDCGNCDGGC